MTQLKLYSYQISGNAHKVRLLLDMYGLTRALATDT
jgi:hypothetical protein